MWSMGLRAMDATAMRRSCGPGVGVGRGVRVRRPDAFEGRMAAGWWWGGGGEEEEDMMGGGV